MYSLQKETLIESAFKELYFVQRCCKGEASFVIILLSIFSWWCAWWWPYVRNMLHD